MEINGVEVEENIRYDSLGLSPELMQALNDKGYTMATPVQGGSIPSLMEWKDVVAKAPTGTGKTFAFGIPIVEHIDPAVHQRTRLWYWLPPGSWPSRSVDELRVLCSHKEGVRAVCLYGGQPIDKQISQLKKKPQIVVATPGRLMDHMKRRTVRLDTVQTVVLDEADRMLDMGFIAGRDPNSGHDAPPQKPGPVLRHHLPGGHGHLLGLPARPGGDHRPPGGGVQPPRHHSSTALIWTAGSRSWTPWWPC